MASVGQTCWQAVLIVPSLTLISPDVRGPIDKPPHSWGWSLSFKPTPSNPAGGTALTSASTFTFFANWSCSLLITWVPALAAQKIISASGKNDEFSSSVEPSPGIISTLYLDLYSSAFFLTLLMPS